MQQWEIDKIEATDNPELGALELEERFLADLEKRMGITKSYEAKDDAILGIGEGIFGMVSRADDPDKFLSGEKDEETVPLINKEEKTTPLNNGKAEKETTSLPNSEGTEETALLISKRELDSEPSEESSASELSEPSDSANEAEDGTSMREDAAGGVHL